MFLSKLQHGSLVAQSRSLVCFDRKSSETFQKIVGSCAGNHLTALRDKQRVGNLRVLGDSPKPLQRKLSQLGKNYNPTSKHNSLRRAICTSPQESRWPMKLDEENF